MIVSGAIDTSDISANANIQGNQIGDRTLTLRNFSSDILGIVKKGTMQVSSSGGTVNTTQVAHGLGFVPVVMGFLNGATIGSITTNGSLPLPTWLNVTMDTIKSTALNGGVALPAVIFQTYIQVFADQTNVYGLLLNATGSAVSSQTITYYLMQESANAS